jgi:putative hemolysin
MDDPSPDSIIWKLILLFVLILINAFFAMSEIAIISLNDNKIAKMAESGHKKAQKVLKLTEDSSRFLSTIQIGVTLAGFLTSASAATTFADMLAGWLIGITGTQSGFALSFISGASVVLITVIMSYFSLVLGELAPKRIAMHNPEKISFSVVNILLFLRSLLKPCVAFLSMSTNVVIRLFGIDPHSEPESVTEEEIRMMVDVGEEKGVIEESQKEMINNIFEFDDIVAADVMTHHTDVAAVDIHDSIDDVVRMATSEGYSRIPVFDDDLDDIKGIIYVKDLLRYVGQDLPDDGLASIMRKAYFVPESKRCGDLFTEMTEKHIQMAVVSDEYGGTAGIVTIEDLLESIVGNIQDEYDDEEEEIEQINDTTFTVDGTTDIEEVDELLGVKLPEGEYDTVGGMIMADIGRIPDEGETPSVNACGYSFTVEEVNERRIERVRIEKLPEPDPNETGSGEAAQNSDKD